MFPLILLVQIAIAGTPKSPGPAIGPVNFAAHFKGFDGCFVLQPLDGSWSLRHNDAGCRERLSPCSTFKIFNAMAALETRAVAGPDTKLEYDGSPQSREVCRKDHTLATAIRDSVVWYFQITAARVGATRMQKFLNDVDYGNHDISAGITQFWLESSLKISADEQVRFLTKLYKNQLPFHRETMDTVKSLIVLERGKRWVLSGKTGTGGSGDKTTLGWFVGHIKSHGTEYVFALNLRASDGANGYDSAKGRAIKILREMGLMKD